MIVKIGNGRKFAWYENKEGWEYEVEKKENGWYLVLDTKNHLWQLSINPDDAIVID